jgi:cytochrome c1
MALLAYNSTTTSGIDDYYIIYNTKSIELCHIIIRINALKYYNLIAKGLMKIGFRADWCPAPCPEIDASDAHNGGDALPEAHAAGRERQHGVQLVL